MQMRKPRHHTRPRVEAMESRALLSALVHPATSHHVDAGIAEGRRLAHAQVDSNYVVFLDNAVTPTGAGVNVEVRGQFIEKGKPPVDLNSLSLDNGKNKSGNLYFPTPPPGSSWSIKVDVRKIGLPPQPPAPVVGFTLPSVSDGKVYAITVIPQGGGQLSVVAGPGR